MTSGPTIDTPSGLAALERAASVWCSQLDPALLSGANAADAATRIGVVIRQLTAAQTGLVGRVDDTRAFRNGRNGHQDAASFLANTAGISLGDANKMMKTRQRLKHCPVAQEAFENGELSLAEANVVSEAAQADPSSEAELVALATRKHNLHGLKERADKVRHAAHGRKSAEERSARQRATRRWRMFRDPEDGAPRADAKFTPEAFALMKPVLDLFQERKFNQNRLAGVHEPSEACAHDAVLEVFLAAGATVGFVIPEPATAEDVPVAPTDRPAPVTARTLTPQLVLLVDAIAVQRGWVAPGETCEIPGVGTVDLDVARRLLGKGVFDVVLHNSVDILAVASTTRYTPRPLKVAVNVRDRRCVVRGCTRERRVERDHGDDYALTHDTSYENLHLLCELHHDEKTHHGARLERHGNEWWWYPPPPPANTHDPNAPPPAVEPWISPVGELLNPWNLDHLPGDEGDEQWGGEDWSEPDEPNDSVEPDGGDSPRFDFGPAA